ncbi:NADP-dependent isocitrate dehydrogenase [Candidatus Kapaibacterium sp.]
MQRNITVAYGNGIGPEIMDATLRILDAAGCNFKYDVIEIGENIYLSGIKSGIAPESWDVLRRNKVFLKSPITTPQGTGYKSLNVTIRKSMGLFASVRPTVAYTNVIHSHFPNMDLIVIRENEEDLYAGIEHQQTGEVIQCLKLISKPGTEKIIRYAFEYARAFGRKKVTCMTKDNIMKHTDGLFHKTFLEIAKEYPEFETNHLIIDIGSARIADYPESFDVIVTLNLYGDIISDIAAEVAGSVGLAGSSNIGDSFAMFEAIHGSAPDIAGKGIANPSGLINGAVMMLMHIGMPEKAELVQNALLKTLEDGYHTPDIYKEATSRVRVGTNEFADEIIKRLGQRPVILKEVKFNHDFKPIYVKPSPYVKPSKELDGIDVFVDWVGTDRNPNVLGAKLSEIASKTDMFLKMITNRGVKVFPDGFSETFCTDHWRCRFKRKSDDTKINHNDIFNLQKMIFDEGFDIIKTENLYLINGERAYTLGQGE